MIVLIRVTNNTIKIWKPATSFHFSYYVNNTFYINDKSIGLKKVVNEKLQLITDGDQFFGVRIYSMLPYKNNQILVATREKGLFLLNTLAKTNAITSFKADANERLINDQVYGGVCINEHQYVYATLLNGVLIMDEKGKIIQTLNKKNGLQDDIVKSIGIDNQNDLWITLSKGISHVEISSPLSSLNEAQGLNGFIQDITKVKNTLYVATSTGVYAYINHQFNKVNGINSQAWAVQKFITKNDTLLIAATESGIYEIKNTTSKLIQQSYGFALCQSNKNKERLYIYINSKFIF